MLINLVLLHKLIFHYLPDTSAESGCKHGTVSIISWLKIKPKSNQIHFALFFCFCHRCRSFSLLLWLNEHASRGKHFNSSSCSKRQSEILVLRWQQHTHHAIEQSPNNNPVSNRHDWKCIGQIIHYNPTIQPVRDPGKHPLVGRPVIRQQLA